MALLGGGLCLGSGSTEPSANRLQLPKGGGLMQTRRLSGSLLKHKHHELGIGASLAASRMPCWFETLASGK
jgi:hypothetical protein